MRGLVAWARGLLGAVDATMDYALYLATCRPSQQTSHASMIEHFDLSVLCFALVARPQTLNELKDDFINEMTYFYSREVTYNYVVDVTLSELGMTLDTAAQVVGFDLLDREHPQVCYPGVLCSK